MKLTPTAKDINEAHRLAKTCAESAVEHAIHCGRLLIATKENLAHGDFGSWCEEHTTFGERTAQLYMKAAKQNADGVAFDSLRSLFPAKEKPKPRAEVADDGPKSDQNRNALRFSNEIPRESSSTPEKTAPVVAVTNATPIITPAPDYDFTDYEPENDEEYRRSIDNVMMADDKLQAMREELKQARREIQALKASRDHYQAESGQAVRLVKARDREIAKLNRQLEARAA